MQKKAEELKKGDSIKVDGEMFTVESVEVSKGGKGKSHGRKKCRLDLKSKDSSEKVIISLADDLFELE